jgi:hypothetical protein
MLSFPPPTEDSLEIDIGALFATPQRPSRSYPRAPTPWEGLSDYVDEAALEVGDDTGLLDVRRMAASYGLFAEPAPARPSRIARATESPVMAEAYFASLPPAAVPDEKMTRLATAAAVLGGSIAAVAFAVALVVALA